MNQVRSGCAVRAESQEDAILDFEIAESGDGHKLIAERAMDRADRLEAALRKYGEHSTQCNRLGVINGDCYCGFAGVLDSLDERLQSDRGADGT